MANRVMNRKRSKQLMAVIGLNKGSDQLAKAKSEQWHG